MATDTIKANSFLLTLAFLFLAINIDFAQGCKFYAQKFDIVSEDYKGLKAEIDSFFASKYEYDAIYLMVLGGQPNSAVLMRTYYDKGWKHYTISERHPKKNKESLNISKETFEHLYKNIEKGHVIEICPYRSEASTHVYLIKHNGLVEFGCSLSENNVSAVQGLRDIRDKLSLK